MGCQKITYYNEGKPLDTFRKNLKVVYAKTGINEKKALNSSTFGSLMPNRHSGSTAEYRYGFNGMEKDNEVKNITGSSYDFGARMYDSRLGRWLAVDPQSSRYTSLSPYNFVANSPIIAVDPNGEEIIVIGNSAYRKKVYKALGQLAKTEAGMEILKAAINSPEALVIQLGTGKNEVYSRGKDNPHTQKNGGLQQYLDLDVDNINGKYEDGSSKTTETVLAHELTHFIDKEGTTVIPYAAQKDNQAANADVVDTYTFSSSEIKAVEAGNKIRATYEQKLRKTYAGVLVYNKELSDKLDYYTDPKTGVTSTQKFVTLKDKQKGFNANFYKGKFTTQETVTSYFKSLGKLKSVKLSDYTNSNTFKKYKTLKDATNSDIKAVIIKAPK